MKKASLCNAFILIGLSLAVGVGAALAGQNAPAARASGDVTQVQSGGLTLHSAKGDVQVELPEGVKILRVPPGAKDLKSAVTITAADVSPGDRAVVIGRPGSSPQSILAVRVVVMSKSDLASYHAAEVREWQTRGIEGKVKAVDVAKGEITIAEPNHPPTPGNLTHAVILTTTPHTAILRYAPDSIMFADAKPSSLDAMHEGDQLRALGTASDDGSHYAAEKIVFGTFHNIGATVISVDSQANTLTVKNLATGKPLLVRVGAECRMHELPPFIAQRIALLSSGAQPGRSGAGGSRRGGAGGAGGGPGEEGGGGGTHHGMTNLNEALENMPLISLNDLKKSEPVVIFGSEGTNPSQVTAIYILTGVEPILAAQPKGSGEVNLGGWSSLGGGGEGGGEGGP